MIKARIDKKTRLKVLCGHIPCGQQLASITEVSMLTAFRVQIDEEAGEARRLGEPEHLDWRRWIRLEPGWKRDAEDRDLWRLSDHASSRLAHTRREATGNGLTSPRKAAAARERLRDQRATRFRRPVYYDNPTVMGHEGGSFGQAERHVAPPVMLVCPRCGVVNLLTEESLDVVTTPSKYHLLIT